MGRGADGCQLRTQLGSRGLTVRIDACRILLEPGFGKPYRKSTAQQITRHRTACRGGQCNCQDRQRAMLACWFRQTTFHDFY